MIRTSGFILAAAALGLAACQPQKTPEQIQAEQAAAAMQQMGAMLGGLAGADGTQVDPNQLAAAIASAGTMASAMDKDMSPEDRAKLQAISGAMASGQVHPAASAWITGANKAMIVLKTVTDVPSANAAKVQLAPIYAEMVGPAATLGAMSEDQQEIAMGSALPQFMSFGMNAATLMMPLSSNPELARLVEDMLDDMPSPD